MPASILDPFVVTSLPRLPPNADLAKLCTIPKIASSGANTFDVGVSGSFIGSFVIRPSPRMIWSYALSPQCIIHALDAHTFEENDDQPERKIFAVTLTERKKHIMKFIDYGKSTEESQYSNQDDVTSISTFTETSAKLEPLKEVKTSEIRLDDQIIDLLISSNGSRVFTIDFRGLICVWAFEMDENKSSGKPLFSLKTSKFASKSSHIVFHKFIDPSQLNIKSSTTIESVVLLVELMKTGLCCHICAISHENVLEISTSLIEKDLSNMNNLHFAYDPSGKLLLLESKPDLKIHLYSLPYTAKIKTVNIGKEVFAKEPEDSTVSLLPVSTNRVLISKNSTLALIDLQYEAVISSLDLYTRSKEVNGNAKPPRSITLLQCPLVKGNSLKTRESFVLLLLKNSKDDHAVMDHVTLDVGLGKLRDVLGKGLHNEIEQSFVGLPLLVTKPEFKSSVKESATLFDRFKEASSKMSQTYDKLKKLHKGKKFDELESNIVSFLKMDKADDIEISENLKVFEVDKDRIVDPWFIKKATLLLFDQNFNGTIQFFESFVPERALTYLLTHPLFPKEVTPGLLNALETSPRLMRQAIVTCPNIPCSDLIEQLSLVESEDIFKDIVARLIDEFSSERITEETIRLLKKQSSRSEGNVNLDKIIQKILKLNYGYEILNSFIDSNGLVLSLHYSKNESQLIKLMNRAQSKINTLKQDTELLSLVNQALILAALYNGKSKGRNKAAKKSGSQSETIVLESETGKLDSMLRICSKPSPAFRETATARIVPSYSVEKLAL
ncbi:hypothetical protein FOA43_001792 [Brettanomyces nanus]|uniref:Uncharacterized protein n=1 Tax=Eeniella nana TaxID=13502 RepID=A0A875S325_EENNA|nr:uncharacterized protein FOA43_001792 [Brettanomyces nanus]QPG74462.1 hypothetical protein FOA43_001792 [Brettanomyces nanus]